MFSGECDAMPMQATISEFIERDLADRIGSEAGVPAPLTITALSNHYGVSATPVREAVRKLVAAGVLVKQQNGRLRIEPGRAQPHRTAWNSTTKSGSPAPASLPPQTTSPTPSPSSQLEETIAAEVISRSLRGESDYLREEATAARFGVGRTSIRQVLGRLAGRGLIDHVPRCGWRVRAFDEIDLDAYLEVREVLELKALDLARPHLVTDDLRRMLAGNSAAGGPSALNNDLHHYLVEKAGNAYIRDFFERHGPYFTTLFDFAAPETHVVSEMAGQHRVILRALIDRDWPRARRELSRHIRAQRPIVKELMCRIGRPEASPRR